jgi:hypothetical protein
MIEIFDCLQDSPEWHHARLGIATASKFATVMAKGRDGGASVTRRSYLYKLAAERITGEPRIDYQSADMLQGQMREPEARDLYAFVTDAEIQTVGFIKNNAAGCSPDGLIGDDGGLEIKCDLPHTQVERLDRGELPPEYKAQVQGCMWVTGRAWWDFVSYCPKLPLFIKRVRRDQDYIENISVAVAKFNEELAEIVDRIRRYSEPAPTVMQQLEASVG